MKIYKRNPLEMDLGGIENYLIPLLGIIVVLLLAWVLFGSGSTQVLSTQLIQNPISLSANDSTILRVHVFNPTAQMAQNTIVQVQAPSAPQLSISPKQQTIPLLGSNETRALEFLILPLDTASNPFTPGIYVIQVSTQLNGIAYQNQVQISIAK